jgi:hypothetical protein
MFEAFIYHSSSIIELLIVLVQCIAINSEEKYLAVGGMDSTTLVFNHSKRAFWACFRENWVYKFGHKKGWSRTLGWSSVTLILLPLCRVSGER